MRIAVIGASGWLGGAVARAAVGRGHEVTAIGRDPEKLAALEGMAPVRADATDVESIAGAIAGHDVVVLSVTDRSSPDRSMIPRATQAVIDAFARADVPRLAMIGGGGSLLTRTASGSSTRMTSRPSTARRRWPPPRRWRCCGRRTSRSTGRTSARRRRT